MLDIDVFRCVSSKDASQLFHRGDPRGVVRLFIAGNSAVQRDPALRLGERNEVVHIRFDRIAL